MLKEVFDESVDKKVINFLKNLSQTVQSRQVLLSSGFGRKEFAIKTLDSTIKTLLNKIKALF